MGSPYDVDVTELLEESHLLVQYLGAYLGYCHSKYAQLQTILSLSI
jgi:hypothetical protein